MYVRELLNPISQLSLEEWKADMEGVTPANIEGLTARLAEVITDAAVGAGMKVQPQPQKWKPQRKVPNQPWFDVECRALRSALMR
jgi:hypothetical protein